MDRAKRFVALLLLICLLSTWTAAADAPRPNILSIMVDEMRWDAMSCAGHPISDDGGATWTSPTLIAKQPGGRLRHAYLFERRPGEVWLALRGPWLRINEQDFLSTP